MWGPLNLLGLNNAFLIIRAGAKKSGCVFFGWVGFFVFFFLGGVGGCSCLLMVNLKAPTT